MNKTFFSADRPIQKLDEDRLGRRGFAEALAQSVAEWSGEDSLVIGVYGEWGSGKSSVKNMVRDALCHLSSEKCPDVAEFNPWQFSGHNELPEAFFREVGIILGRHDRSKAGQERADRWQLYAEALHVGASLASGLRSAGPYLVFLGLLVFGATALANPVIKLGGFIAAGLVAVLGGLLTWSAKFAERVSRLLRTRASIQQKTLQEYKSDLADVLKGRTKPVLVVIDDIDRLTREEIRQIFQLVKANADLPKLVYLLLFQRDVVERSLARLAPISGREFLKKIVQVEFNVPEIDPPRLERILDEGLDRLLSTPGVQERFDKERWYNVFIPGLRRYFKSLRDVYRFLASLEFHLGLFRTESSFAVNPVDLIALEGLRVFEPDVYRQLPDAKHVVTGSTADLDRQRGAKETREVVESILQVCLQTRDRVEVILKQLFPRVQGALENYGISGGEERWQRELRVCDPDIFGRYFSLSFPEGDIPQPEFDRLLALIGDREGLVQALRALGQRQLLGVAVDRLEAWKEKIDLKHAVPFVTAMLDIGDELPEGGGGFFFIEPEMHVSRIIHWFLLQEKEVAKRGAILKEAIEQTNGLFMPIRMVSGEEDEKSRKERPEHNLVEETQLPALRERCVKKIREAAATQKLAKNRHLAFILFRWREWAGEQEPKEWAKNLVTTPDGFLDILVGFTQRSASQTMGSHVSRIHWRISLKDLELFVPVEELQRRLEQIAIDGLTERQQLAVQALKKALKRRAQGKPDDSWARDDEDD